MTGSDAGSDARRDGAAGGATGPDRYRPLLVAALGAVPWTVVVYPRGVDLIFPWGLVNTNPLVVVDLPSYLFVYTAGPASLPDRLTAWPESTVLFGLAVASASLALLDREDPRVTAVLLALAGIVHARVALGLIRLGETAYPVGTGLLLGAAWWAFGRGRE